MAGTYCASGHLSAGSCFVAVEFAERSWACTGLRARHHTPRRGLHRTHTAPSAIMKRSTKAAASDPSFETTNSTNGQAHHAGADPTSRGAVPLARREIGRGLRREGWTYLGACSFAECACAYVCLEQSIPSASGAIGLVDSRQFSLSSPRARGRLRRRTGASRVRHGRSSRTRARASASGGDRRTPSPSAK